MTKRRSFGAVVLILAISMVAVSCGRDSGSSSSKTSTTSSGGGKAQAAGPATTSDCQNYQGTQGVTDTSIKIGSSFPQSGLYAPFAEISKGYLAYFKDLNANQNGVNGRQINFVSHDDMYQSAKTKANYETLTQSDKAFALFNIVGTPNNEAIRPDQNSQCVPNLYVATGAATLSQPDKYPWTIGSIPTYETEMATFVEYLKDNKPNAKIAVLYQNDDFGLAYYDSLKALVKGTNLTIVKTASYDSSNVKVDSQISQLAGSGADTLLLATTTLACPNSLGALQSSSWNPKPLTYISATCTSSTLIGLAPKGSADGVISSIYLKDPLDPEWANDPGMKAYKSALQAAGLPQADINNGLLGYGYAMGQLLAYTLENAKSLTRVDVMNEAWHLKNVELDMLLPGIKVNTNGTQDPYPIEQMRIGTYNGTYWDLGNKLYDFEGKSGTFNAN
jgi:branched-chain amino acid transport system substrate-binding protein